MLAFWLRPKIAVNHRFERVGDLFNGVLTKPQELAPALEKLGQAMS